MMILGLETATELCAVAAVSGGMTIASEYHEEKNAHAERIMGMIEHVVAQAGGMSAFGGIAVSLGPGSFTGLRIGLSVAKGLAFARALPLAGVPTLEALLEQAGQRPGQQEGAGNADVLAVLQARRGEYYVRGSWETGVSVKSPARILSDYSGRTLVLVGDAGRLGADIALPAAWVLPEPGIRCSAITVARMGERRIVQGDVDDPALLEPAYTMEVLFKQTHPERT
jgi:tRNA threonylcarbamoyladenosine biosynthesis protein TsaB